MRAASGPEFFQSILQMKSRQAASNLLALSKLYHLTDKTMILDVGCNVGLMVSTIREYSKATVLGVEPDKEAFKLGCQNKYLSAKTDRCCRVQDLPNELNGRFDLITIFLFCIPFDERSAVFERIAALLKPHGDLFIGTELEEYTSYPRPGSASLIPVLSAHFGSINADSWRDPCNYQTHRLVCKEPKKSEVIVDQRDASYDSFIGPAPSLKISKYF